MSCIVNDRVKLSRPSITPPEVRLVGYHLHGVGGEDRGVFDPLSLRQSPFVLFAAGNDP